jgi:hypothetical protein
MEARYPRPWDTGLLKVTLSPDCRLESATMAWTSLAYIRRYDRFSNLPEPDQFWRIRVDESRIPMA